MDVKDENQKTELETLIAYSQLIYYTLRHSNTEIDPKAIRSEITMFYKKFGNEEVRKLSKSILKEKGQK